MAIQGSSKRHRNTGVKNPVYTARVSYPIDDRSPKEIRDNILLDYFGYTEKDITTLDKEKRLFLYQQ